MIMFDVSKNAVKRIKEISFKEKHEYFRISVDGGGCQGFSYKFNFDKIINDEDQIFTFNDVKILTYRYCRFYFLKNAIF